MLQLVPVTLGFRQLNSIIVSRICFASSTFNSEIGAHYCFIMSIVPLGVEEKCLFSRGVNYTSWSPLITFSLRNLCPFPTRTANLEKGHSNQSYIFSAFAIPSTSEELGGKCILGSRNMVDIAKNGPKSPFSPHFELWKLSQHQTNTLVGKPP